VVMVWERKKRSMDQKVKNPTAWHELAGVNGNPGDAIKIFNQDDLENGTERKAKGRN